MESVLFSTEILLDLQSLLSNSNKIKIAELLARQQKPTQVKYKFKSSLKSFI